MHPSLAERFYMEQDQRQREAWAAEAEAQRVAAFAHAQAVARAQAATTARQASKGQMTYTEITHELGEVVISGDIANEPCFIPIPGEFGTALSLVMTATLGERVEASRGADHLWMYLMTSLDGEHWFSTATAGVTTARVIPPNGVGWASWRLNGPFANRLAFQCFARFSARTDDNNTWRSGHWAGLSVTIGAQIL